MPASLHVCTSCFTENNISQDLRNRKTYIETVNQATVRRSENRSAELCGDRIELKCQPPLLLKGETYMFITSRY